MCSLRCSKGSCIPGFGEALIQSSASQTTREGPVWFPPPMFHRFILLFYTKFHEQVHWLHLWMSQLCEIVIRVSKHLFFISVLISLWTTDNQFSDRHQAVSQPEQHCGRSVTSLFWSQSHCGSATPLAIKEWSPKS